MSTIEELKRFNIFSGWSKGELEEIAPYLKEEKIKKNKILFEQNAPASKVYFIKSGCIELRIIITDKKDARLARIKSGEMFGEMSVFDNKARSTSAVAFMDTALITLKKENLYEFLNKNDKDITNKLLTGFIKELSARLRAVDDEIRHMNLYT